jgi:hypothetical protein
MTVEVDEKTARALDALRSRAAARGMTVGDYLMGLASASDASPAATAAAETLATNEFDRLLDELPAGLPALAPLPVNHSRADIYDEHE